MNTTYESSSLYLLGGKLPSSLIIPCVDQSSHQMHAFSTILPTLLHLMSHAILTLLNELFSSLQSYYLWDQLSWLWFLHLSHQWRSWHHPSTYPVRLTCQASFRLLWKMNACRTGWRWDWWDGCEDWSRPDMLLALCYLICRAALEVSRLLLTCLTNHYRYESLERLTWLMMDDDLLIIARFSKSANLLSNIG